jgi:hypothetical protein
MYFSLFDPPVVKNRVQAERALWDALWDYHFGRVIDAREGLEVIANFVAERTLDGSYTNVPEQIPAQESATDETGAAND